MIAEYKDEHDKLVDDKIEEMLKGLPRFCTDFAHARERKISSTTRITYLRCIRVFLDYLHDNNSYFGKRDIKQYTVDDLLKLNTSDIEDFAHYIEYNPADNGRNKEKGKVIKNQDHTVDHYLSALSALWKYFIKHDFTTKNPVANVERSSKKDHVIIRLKDGEEDQFMRTITTGEGLSDRQVAFLKKSTKRDLAICMTFLKTGIRVSELVGLNVDDINLQEGYFYVRRKRDKLDKVYFDDTLRNLLIEYYNERATLPPADGERAMFLVERGKYKGKRLSVRSVELLVKKYAKAALPSDGKMITPHKLRATYATNVLNKTDNLRLVQVLMAHENVNTTQLYADLKDEDDQKKKVQKEI